MQDNNHPNDPQSQQQWANYDQERVATEEPLYSPEQNGLQIVINLPPQQGYPQDPNNPHQNAPSAQGNAGYNPGFQPYQAPMDNNNPTNAAYSYLQTNDDDVKPPARSEDRYKVGDDAQPDQAENKPQYSAPASSPSSSSSDCSNLRKPVAGLILFFIGANLAIIIALMVYHFGEKDVTLTSVAGALAYVSFNLAQDPIMDIIVKDDTESCPLGYSSILLGTWPGTVPGCDCPVSGLKKGACQKRGKHQTDLLCTDISSTGSIQMFDWGDSKWCVLRAKADTEYTRTLECGEGFRECSPGTCVLSSLNCPVTKVGFATSGTYKLKLGTNRYVVTERTEGQSSLIDIAVTPNNVPCFNEDYYAAGPTKPYLLINAHETGCGKYGLDEQYSFQIDAQTQDKLFSQNSFSDKVLDLTDYDDVYEKTYSVLSYRKRMDVAENEFCLNIDAGLLDKSSKAADDLNEVMTGTSIAAIIIHSIFTFFMCAFFVITLCKGKFKSFFEKSTMKTWVIPCTVLGLLEYIDLIIMFASARKHRGSMVATKDYLFALSGMDCFVSTQAEATVTDYQVAVDVVAGTLYKYSLALFLICTFCCVVPSIYLSWRVFKKK